MKISRYWIVAGMLALCSGSTMQTMCAATALGTSYKRTLESHDEHTFASAY
jgi:hypothetical protein